MTHMSIKHEGARQQLVRLLDAELNAVTFVRDYMQLHFDGPTLDAFTMPTVIVDDRGRAIRPSHGVRRQRRPDCVESSS